MENRDDLENSPGKKILMASCNYWTSPFQVGSHHLARAFAKKGWKVAYISDPITPFHFLKGLNSHLKERFKIFRKGGVKDPENNIWTYVPGALIRPRGNFFLNHKWILDNWVKCSLPNLIKKINKKGFGEVDLLYMDNPIQHSLLDSINFKKAIYRIADNNQGFLKSSSHIPYAEKKIAEKVDAVVYSAQTLEDQVKLLNPKRFFHLPNGINLAHFLKKSKAPPLDFNNIPKPIAIFVGAIDFWFDFELINFSAKSLPHVSFVLIGSKTLAKKRLKPFPNIYLLGPRPYSQVPFYLQFSDVGLIPFNIKKYPDLVNFINPLKLYEYLAAGLKVISVEWKELMQLKSPAILCRNRQEFVDGIQRATENRTRLNDQIPLDYIATMDWNNRRDQIIQNFNL